MVDNSLTLEGFLYLHNKEQNNNKIYLIENDSYTEFETNDILDIYLNFNNKSMIVVLNGKKLGDAIPTKFKHLFKNTEYRFGISSSEVGDKVMCCKYDNKTFE